LSLELAKETTMIRPAPAGVDPALISYNQNFYSVLLKPYAGTEGRCLDYYFPTRSGWQRSQDPQAFSWAHCVVDFLRVAERRPWILINGPSRVLSQIRLDEAAREVFCREPVAVFLFEPLFYQAKRGSPWFPAAPDQVDFYCDELDSLLDFVENHGGQVDLTIYVCDHALPERIRAHPKYGHWKFRTMDIFLVDCALRQPPPQSLPGATVAKSALCLNFRYDTFREIVVAYLRAKNYHERSFLTFFHAHGRPEFSNIPFPWRDWRFRGLLEEGIAKMQPELPYTLEVSRPRRLSPAETDIPDLSGFNRRDDDKLVKFYQSAGVCIANETRYYTYFPNLSEKTLNAALFLRPFVVVGAPGCLAYMRELGFRSFGDFWDESYDEALDHRERLERLFRTFDQIFALTPKQLNELLWSMQPELYYNRMAFQSLPARQKRFLENE
jgi:hypothetical protein